MQSMQSHIRDTILVLIVVAALVITGSTLYGVGRRLPPPPEVRPNPAPQVAPDPQYH